MSDIRAIFTLVLHDLVSVHASSCKQAILKVKGIK